MQEFVRPEIKKIEVNLIQLPTRDNDQTAIAFARLTTKGGQVFEDIKAVSATDGMCCSSPTCIIRLAVLNAKGRVFHDAMIFNNTPEALYEMYANSGLSDFEMVDEPDEEV